MTLSLRQAPSSRPTIATAGDRSRAAVHAAIDKHQARRKA
jgi:hypothetical protein